MTNCLCLGPGSSRDSAPSSLASQVRVTNYLCLSGTRKLQGLSASRARNGTVLGKPQRWPSTPVLSPEVEYSISIMTILIMNNREALAPCPIHTVLDHPYPINSQLFSLSPLLCCSNNPTKIWPRLSKLRILRN